MFLKLLQIDNNQLRSLPKGIGKLRNLRFIDFSNNNIEEIPKELGN